MKSGICCGHEWDFASSEAELRALYGAPSELSARKSLSQLDVHCRNFIERSPFLCLSTAAADGTADVSPRGDAPGFVRVLDEHTLLIPDRLGNNRIDSLRNVLQNANVGLLFLVPGVDETLRVNGLAQVVVRSTLLEACAVNGKVPKTGLLIEVREAFLQCAKALIRSRLWTDEYRLARDQLPTLGKILVDQIGLATPVGELEAMIEKAYCEKLY
ncbi:MAG: pyridoxamine 5'-phosphate oxidase family protein [Planctomycetia bacterium]|nr:pyridoxamine 5'-phosphate oxidase family protein [Planctomycetia bacterium]